MVTSFGGLTTVDGNAKIDESQYEEVRNGES